MHILPSVLLALVLLVIAVTTSAEEGSELHQQACTDCHIRMTGGDGSVLYTRKQRLVNDLNSLSKRVTYCAEGAGTHWQQSQIDLVTEYLNQQYYRF